MAIMGFLVHTLDGQGEAVEAALQQLPDITTYGLHKECYVVAVAEAPSKAMEDTLAQVHALEGVLTCYVTSLTVEDELEEPEQPA